MFLYSHKQKKIHRLTFQLTKLGRYSTQELIVNINIMNLIQDFEFTNTEDKIIEN